MSKPVFILLLPLVLACVLPAHAQQPYASKPLHLVIPNPPGGGMDSIGRVLAKDLAASLGQAVIVDNRPGGGENIGINAVAKAAPDGYTLLLSSNTITMNPSLYKALPYDAAKDLVPVGRVTTIPLLIVSHPSLAVHNIGELIAYAKANPDKLSYGTPGNGTPHHLAMELFKSEAGVRVVHVPYKGTGPGLADILGGHIPLLMATTAPIQQPVAKGQLRALGVMEKSRLPEFREVASISETLPGFEVGIWHGVFAPAGVPGAVLHRLAGAVESVVKEADFRNQMTAMGVVAKWVTPEETAALMKSERDKWAGAIRKAGIEPE